jgi:hypothetical protein
VKRIFMALGILMSVSTVYAMDIWKSSTTATSVTGVNMLCTETRRGILHGICTDFGVAAASTTIVNSTFTISGVSWIGPVSTLVADQCKYFDTVVPNGMGYHKPNVATVTILYDCY